MRRFVRTLLISLAAATLIVGIRLAMATGLAVSWNDMMYVAFATVVMWICLFVVDVLFFWFMRKRRDGAH